MEESPPRRPRRGRGDGSSSVPLIPVLIGVIVLGFVIGAGLSFLTKGPKSGDSSPNGSQSVASSATAVPTDAPLASPPTDAPTDTPTPITTPSATTSPAAEPSTKPRSPAPTLSPAPSPSPAITATPAETPVPVATPAERHSAIPEASPRATPKPALTAPTPLRSARPPVAIHSRAPVIAAAPVASASARDAPTSSDETDTEFSKLATAVVRQYLAAISRGDTASAQAAFGPGGGSANLTELGIVDASTRISHVEAHSAGENVAVDVDMKSPSGNLFGQYTVHRTPEGAAVIVNHQINKL